MEHGMLAVIVYTSSWLLKRKYLLKLTEIFSFCDERSSHQPLIKPVVPLRSSDPLRAPSQALSYLS